MNRPTFFLLGATKAGTTSLHYYLSQHPDILMSDPKEPPFFRLEYERGPEWYWRTYYRRYAGQRAAGDGAPQNLYLPFVAARIAATVPEARLLALCRHPVDRAVSAWWHNVRIGVEPLPFEAAIEKNLRRLERGPTFSDEREAARYLEVARVGGNAALQREFGFYVEPGHYADAIERYQALFGADRMKVLFFDDLARDPEGVTGDVVSFLGLPPHPLRDSRPQNEATSPAATRLNSLISRIPGVSAVSPELRARIRAVIARSGKKGVRKPEVTPQLRRTLGEYYRPHNRRLAALTGRDLAAWESGGEAGD